MSAKISLRLTTLVVFTTLVFTLLGWILPEFLRFIQYPLLGILLVTIGLPHGATDYLLFRRMHRSKLTKKQIFRFFAIYVTAVLGFLLFWLIFPLYSFIIFIVISAYHFGQSNWENIIIPKAYSILINFFWGVFAIGGSVLWHWDESKMIIGQVIGFIPDLSLTLMANIQVSLVIINVLIILFLKYHQKLNTLALLVEISKIIILSLLFYFTPMLVGFALYFALWHSLSSLKSQLSYYKKLWPSFTIGDYYRQAAPYTILAVFGFIMMVIGHTYILPNVSMISTFLVFIACVTLPHIFVVDESYQQ
ncbi:MAG TPA: Brp/Blh family beta-carotene 15,15'-dioxygenase [Saprospiraceae bacterium]|nr:Brp/Blh family beta-carotene 15,15'-dioxygenase [Saprospiraceae bacterium]